jgi:hypothetical protein
MSLSLVPEDEVRAALRPYRPDRDAFEAAVRERLQVAEQRQAADPLWRASPLLKSAAAFLPLQVLAGCKAAPAASNATASATGAAGGYKLISYLAFPAISLFVLLGAAGFSARKIRAIRDASGKELSDSEAMREATSRWWRENRWSAWTVFAVTIALALLGASWLLFLFYIVSFGLLLSILSSLAKLGLGNRQLIGRSCMLGLMFLGQTAMISGIGIAEIHFLDQAAVGAVFFGGVLVLLPFTMGVPQLLDTRIQKPSRWMWAFAVAFAAFQALLAILVWSVSKNPWIVALVLGSVLILVGTMVYQTRFSGQRIAIPGQRTAAVFMAVLLVPLMAFVLSPVVRPVSRADMKRYVESYAAAPHHSVSWESWEIVTRWAIESKLDPDLTQPRRLIAEEFAGKQNPYILGSALRTGLLPVEQVGEIREYDRQRRSFVDHPAGLKPQAITSLAYNDWAIRGAALRGDLSPAERDYLEGRLIATLQEASQSQQVELRDLLLVTQLLEVIGRPVDRERYRGLVHDLLREFQSKKSGGFQFAGGFKKYRTWPVNAWHEQTGSLDSTAYAIELMETYGVPANLDLNWVRSFLRPSAMRFGDQKYVAASALDRLNHLPGVRRPGWIEVLYYERSLLAACVLVGLCVYATLISPPRNFTPASVG